MSSIELNKLLIKLHFLNDVIDEERDRETRVRNGLNSMFFENYKNLDIPRNFTAKVYEHLTVNLTYPRHPLTTIMKIKNPLYEKLSLNSSRIEFEMLFNTMKKSYAMNLTCPSICAEVNQHECAKISDFKMEMSIIYKKSVRKKVQVLKEMFLDANSSISINYLHVNLTSNIFMWMMILDQIYRKMKKEASVKHDLMKKIINTDFLKENLLKRDYEIENEHILYETKIPDDMKFGINVRRIEWILFTKNDNNTMKALIENYELTATLENKILSATHYFAYLALLSEKLKENYLKTKNLIYHESRDTKFDDILPRKFLLKFDTIDLFYNWDLMLSASNDLNDLALITKYFKRQNLSYRVLNKVSYIESVEIIGNNLIIDWYLGGRRYLKFKATDVLTINTK